MNVLFLDTETTGLEKADRLIQLAFKKPKDAGVKDYYFQPLVRINFEAMATHHITEKRITELSNGIAFADWPGRQAFQKQVSENILVAHNALFDIGMLAREGIEVGQFICTKKVANFLFDEQSYRLQYLRYKFDLDVNGKAHDAEGDVLVLEALFNFLYDTMEAQGHRNVLAQMMEISKNPILLRRISFGKHKGLAFDEIPGDYLSWLRKQTDLDEDLIYTLDYYLQKL